MKSKKKQAKSEFISYRKQNLLWTKKAAHKMSKRKEKKRKKKAQTDPDKVLEEDKAYGTTELEEDFLTRWFVPRFIWNSYIVSS